MSRTSSRELAYLVLFSNQFRKIDCTDETILDVADGKPVTREDLDFIKQLVSGVINNLEELRDLVGRNVQGYTLDRLHTADLVVLLLATYELKFEDTPASVAINEAVNLAKKYSEPKGAGFVNSVLNKINQELSNE